MSKLKNYNHFGHHHTLIPLHLDEGEKINCNGCEKLITEPFHGCLSCNYYIHFHCLGAPRSLEHPAHPSHPLTLLPTPTYPSCCFACEACGSKGRSFSYSCACCEFDLHMHCGLLATTIKLDDEKHPHELQLQGFDPAKKGKNLCSFECGICGSAVEKQYWSYVCGECGFVAHLECADENQEEEEEEEEEEEGDGTSGGVSDQLEAMRQLSHDMVETQLALARMQNQINLANAMCNIMRRM